MNNPVEIISHQRPDVLQVRWAPNNVCNFSCRYCWPGSHAGTYRSPNDLELIVKNFNHLFKEYREKLGKTRIHFGILGGEPTLWKDLHKFIFEIKKNDDIYFTVITNGSRTLRWWKKYGYLIDNLTLSFHVAQADLNHTIEVADVMYEFNTKTTVKVLMDIKHWDSAVKAVDYMKKNSKHPWFIQVCPVIEQEGNKEVYNTEQKKYLKTEIKRIPSIFWIIKNLKLLKSEIKIFESTVIFDNKKSKKTSSNFYRNNNWSEFLGWSCNIASESIYIGWEGNIKGSCDQPIFDQSMSNILDIDFSEKFMLTAKPVICQRNFCHCAPDNHISKKKIS
jgi:organic radical activating enzyme